MGHHFSNQTARVNRDWTVEYTEHDRRPLVELETEFYQILRKSIRQVADNVRCGCFLSGSALFSILSEFTQNILHYLQPNKNFFKFAGHGLEKWEVKGVFGPRPNNYSSSPSPIPEKRFPICSSSELCDVFPLGINFFRFWGVQSAFLV